ncbi:MAG: hypothetical protein WD491_00530 [Balneolales bacterium]
MKVTIGLDFGTYQTKVCLRVIRNDTTEEFHFVTFDKDSSDTFFFRSAVHVKNNRFLFGEISESVEKSFHFFKIASAEDIEFRKVSKQKDIQYEESKFAPYTPELLSVLYLTSVILQSKKFIEDKVKQNKRVAKPTSFLSRFISSKEEKEETEYFVQLGIPTEYHREINIQRRKKFELILLLAKRVSDNLTHNELQEKSCDEIINLVSAELKVVKLGDQSQWTELLESEVVSVMPESAAGLSYLVGTGKITKESHCISVDIGGGSTDISYFKVESNRTFTYLASESILIACNNIYKNYAGSISEELDIEGAMNQLHDHLHISNDETYAESFQITLRKINRLIKNIYNGRIYRKFMHGKARENFTEATCYLFGGGSTLPMPNINPDRIFKEVLLYDGGVNDSFDTSDHIIASVENVEGLTPTIYITNKGWEQHLPMLVVALGLSLNKPADLFAKWNELEYQRNEQYVTKEEDPGLYDIFNRIWV